jgi:hypothetical protein
MSLKKKSSPYYKSPLFILSLEVEDVERPPPRWAQVHRGGGMRERGRVRGIYATI